jgi:hypothetical protein
MAVAVDGDHCAVFEMTQDYEMAEGHRLRGRLESDLCFALENLTTGEMLDVMPLGVHLSLEDARREVGRP